MKKLFYLFSIIMFLSCGKDGNIGPQGEQGEQGERGPEGIKGVDGSTLLYGTLDPKISDGKIGDFYFNVHNLIMFGPKSTTGWGVGNKIKGEKGKDGVNGESGSKIIKGQGGTPDEDIGNIGDYFFDTTSGNFYGPKAPGYWGRPISLRATKSQNVKLYLMKPEFKNAITLNGQEVEVYSQKAKISEPWNSFLEIFYHERQANISYPKEIFLLNWNQIWTAPVPVKDILLPSGKLLKNVRLTMILDRPSGSTTSDYEVSFKLNATMSDTDTSELSGDLFDVMVRIYYYAV